MAKLPAIQFYPGDWLKDSVSGCSLAAQGLWLRMMFVMHVSDRYGYLSQNGLPIPSDQIARRCGLGDNLSAYESLLAELDAAGVPSRSRANTIYSRRMVRDATERAKDAERQKDHRDKKNRKSRNGHADVTPMSQPSSSSSSISSFPLKPPKGGRGRKSLREEKAEAKTRAIQEVIDGH